MKPARLVWTINISTLLILSLVSCTSNMKLQKKQSENIRRVGEAYLAEEKYVEAYRELLKAKEIYPRDPNIYYDIGILYYKKGKFDKAIGQYKKALEIKPDFAKALNNLGVAYLAQKNWDAAIDCFNKLVDNDNYETPHFPVFLLGRAYYNKKAYTLAEKYFQETLKIDPGYIFALQWLGRTYTAMGRVDEAVKTLEKAVKLSPKFLKLYFDLAEAYKLSFDYKKALNAYNKVIELAPESPLAIKAEKEAEKIKISGYADFTDY